MSELNEEQTGRDTPRSLIVDSMVIGFYSGVFWSFLAQVAYFLNFLDFSPKFLLTSWITLEWAKGWLGVVISILLFGILSILAALIYYALLKKVTSIFAGLLYGVVLWLVLVFIFKPMFPDFPSYAEMTGNTIITSICLFILFGVSIGYSISYEHQELEKIEKMETEAKMT
ncbi:YqhR family membrane protein [Bacillus sp. V59.32b]|uniref:YqhR family membrane protein n=1 Tax=Bacillus sp. V59.32b TaxID=1758642 RepID=UPI001357AB0E|nr:YqhR family membrane protein [Bacillus sp. V59.32b]